MKQLPTKGQLTWIVGIAVAFTLFSGTSGWATVGYFAGQITVLSLIVIGVKAIRSGATRLKNGATQSEN